MNAKPSREDQGPKKSTEWLYVVLGVGLALGTTPVLFLILWPIMGGVLALVVCAVEVRLIVAVGGFAVAYRIFYEDVPEVSDIFRLTIRSNLLVNIVITFLIEKMGMDGADWLCTVISTVGSVVVASFLCILYFEMPVIHAIVISICYNVFAAILAVIGIFLLTMLFAGYLVTAGAGDAHKLMKEMGAPQDSGSFSTPGSGDDEESEGGVAPKTAPDESSDLRRPTLGLLTQMTVAARGMTDRARFHASPSNPRSCNVLSLGSSEGTAEAVYQQAS